MRTRVHEYGGGAFTVEKGVVIFANDADQRLYRIDTARPAPWRAEALTSAQGTRYADLQIDGRLGRVICVAERARPQGEPENFIASVSLASGDVSVLAAGADFYAFPRIDPTGSRLAYLSWNHPAMPWDACELHVADIGAHGALTRPPRWRVVPASPSFSPRGLPPGSFTSPRIAADFPTSTARTPTER